MSVAGHEVAKDFKSFMTDLQIRLQRTRDNYTATQHEAENLMMKMLEARKSVSLSSCCLLDGVFSFFSFCFVASYIFFYLHAKKPQDSGSLNKMFTRQGYLFLLEKSECLCSMIANAASLFIDACKP
jgi:hypothetical protein